MADKANSSSKLYSRLQVEQVNVMDSAGGPLVRMFSK